MAVLDRDGSAPQRTVYRYKKLRYGLILLFFAALFVVGVLALVAVPGVLIKPVALFVALAMGLILWIQASYLFLPENLVTIDKFGVWDQRISTARIPWQAIKRAYRKSSLAGPEHVYLELAYPFHHRRPRLVGIGRLFGTHRRTARLYLVNPGCLTGNAEDILAAIRGIRPDLVTSPPDPLGPETSVDPAESAGYHGDAERLVAHRDRKVLAVFLATSLVTAAFFATYLFSDHRRQITEALFLGGATLFALWLLREILLTEPRLTIDRAGITLRDFGSRTVPWHAIRDIKVTDQFISVEEVKPENAPAPGPIASFFSRADPVIVAFALSAGTDEIRAAVAHFRAQASAPSSSGR